MSWFYQFLIAGLVILALDMFWLIVVANKFYRGVLGSIMREKASLPPAVIFYVLYLVGLTVFVTAPAASVAGAFGYGALFGLVAYGTYDLTNAATLKIWATKLTVVDMLWGALLSSLAAGIARTVISG
jgi:uncharacterized membrane protein